MKKLTAIFLVLCMLFTACGQEMEESYVSAQVHQCTVCLTDSGRITDRGVTIVDFTMKFSCEDNRNHKGTVYGEIYISSRQDSFEILDVKITSVPWVGYPWQFQGNALTNITHSGSRVMITVSGLFEKENKKQDNLINENLPGKFLKIFGYTVEKPAYERVTMCDYSHYIYRADILAAIAEGECET